MRTISINRNIKPSELYFINKNDTTFLTSSLYLIQFSIYHYNSESEKVVDIDFGDEEVLEYATGWYYPDLLVDDEVFEEGYYFIEWKYQKEEDSDEETLESRFVIDTFKYDYIPYLGVYELKQSAYSSYFTSYSDEQLSMIVQIGASFIETYTNNIFYPALKDIFYSNCPKVFYSPKDFNGIISFVDQDDTNLSDYIVNCDGELIELTDDLEEVYFSFINGVFTNSGFSPILDEAIVAYVFNNLSLTSSHLGVVSQEQTDRHMVKYSIPSNSLTSKLFGDSSIVLKLNMLKRRLVVGIL